MKLTYLELITYLILFPSTLFSYIHKLGPSHTVKNHVSHPYKTSANFIVFAPWFSAFQKV